jgi:hypothetical protein
MPRAVCPMDGGRHLADIQFAPINVHREYRDPRGLGMPTPIVFEDVAPVVPVRDLHAALERYRQLGFEVRAYGHGTGYGYAQRGAVSIHLSEWDEHDPKRTGVVIYLAIISALDQKRR